MIESSYITKDNSSFEDKPKIFLSYKKTDNEFKSYLDETIKAIFNFYDVAIWVDRNLISGTKYDDVIRKEIESCDAFILILTKDIFNSDYVWNQEVALAKKLNKPIIPINFELNKEQLMEADKRLNKIHIINYDKGDQELFCSKINLAIKIHVFDKKLIDRVKDFFNSNKDKISFKFLTIEQLYLYSIGLLKGIKVSENIGKSVSILESIANMKPYDDDFVSLQEDILELLFAYYIKKEEIDRIPQFIEKSFDLDGKSMEILYNAMRSDYSNSLCKNDDVAKSILNYILFKVGFYSKEELKSLDSIECVYHDIKSKKANTEINEDYVTFLAVDSFKVIATENEGYLLMDDIIIDDINLNKGPGLTDSYYFYFDKINRLIHCIYRDWCHYDPTESYFIYYKYKYDIETKKWKVATIKNKELEKNPFTPPFAIYYK